MGALFAPDTLIDSQSQKDAKEKNGAALELLPQDSYTVEKIRTPKLYTIYGSPYQVSKKCNMPLPQYVPRPIMPPKMPPPNMPPPQMPPIIIYVRSIAAHWTVLFARQRKAHMYNFFQHIVDIYKCVYFKMTGQSIFSE